MIKTYFNTLRSFSFAGRMARKQFWVFFSIHIALFLLIEIVAEVMGLSTTGSGDRSFSNAGFFFLIAGLIQTMAAKVRRLHDSGKSGIWLLAILVPMAGQIAILILTLLPGTKGPNKYDQALPSQKD